MFANTVLTCIQAQGATMPHRKSPTTYAVTIGVCVLVSLCLRSHVCKGESSSWTSVRVQSKEANEETAGVIEKSLNFWRSVLTERSSVIIGGRSLPPGYYDDKTDLQYYAPGPEFYRNEDDTFEKSTVDKPVAAGNEDTLGM